MKATPIFGLQYDPVDHLPKFVSWGTNFSLGEIEALGSKLTKNYGAWSSLNPSQTVEIEFNHQGIRESKQCRLMRVPSGNRRFPHLFLVPLDPEVQNPSEDFLSEELLEMLNNLSMGKSCSLRNAATDTRSGMSQKRYMYCQLIGALVSQLIFEHAFDDLELPQRYLKKKRSTQSTQVAKTWWPFGNKHSG